MAKTLNRLLTATIAAATAITLGNTLYADELNNSRFRATTGAIRGPLGGTTSLTTVGKSVPLGAGFSFNYGAAFGSSPASDEQVDWSQTTEEKHPVQITNINTQTRGTFTKIRTDYITRTDHKKDVFSGMFGIFKGGHIGFEKNFGNWGALGLDLIAGYQHAFTGSALDTTMQGYSNIRVEDAGKVLADETLRTSGPQTVRFPLSDTSGEVGIARLGLTYAYPLNSDVSIYATTGQVVGVYGEITIPAGPFLMPMKIGSDKAAKTVQQVVDSSNGAPYFGIGITKTY